MRIIIIALTFALIATPPRSSAQETKDWIGKKVIFKESTHSPIFTRENRGTGSARSFTVKRVNRDLLYIVTGEAGFWVPAREVLLSEKASESLTDQIRLNPRDAQAYFDRVFFRMGNKDYDNAIADFAEVISLTPKDARAYYGRALACKRKRDFAKAITDLNETVRLEPLFAPAYNERAWLWATCTDAKFRDAAKAIESARKACELTSGPQKASFLDTLAAAYAEAGDFANAVKTQAEANDFFAGNEQRRRGGSRMILYQEKKPYRE
jgi:tetratricopeptide (TPR) repeat protein